MFVIILYCLLIFIVIQTTEGRKNLENIKKSINPRELKGEKEPQTASNVLFSPHQFSLNIGGLIGTKVGI